MNKPSMWNRIKAALRAFNYLEAGRRLTRHRSTLPGWVRDARFDVSSAERREVLRKSRYFQYNNALANRLCDLFELYTVGANGLQVTPASSDEAWNEVRLKSWGEWCKYPDLTSRQSFGTLQGLITRLWFFDGECFIIKTKSKPVRGQNGQIIGPARPRIQIVEAHRCETPDIMADREGREIIEGIEVDDRGRPIAYWIKDGQTDIFSEAQYRRFNAEDVIHVFEPSRAGQYRGLPLIYPVINDLNDLDDLQILEMQAAKQNAQKTRVIKTASGEDEEGDAEEVPFLGKQRSTDTNEVSRQDYYKTAFGAETQILKHGDEYAEYVPQRPSVAVQQYWEYLITKICAGVGIDKQLVYPTSMQGTLVRGTYDIADAFFRARSSVIADVVLEIYRWQTEWETQNIKELADPPADWREATTCPPRSVNADVGRNASAMLSMLDKGATTLEDIYAPQGKNWLERVKQRAREIAATKHQANLASGLYPDVTVSASEITTSIVEDAAAPAQPAAVNPVAP